MNNDHLKSVAVQEPAPRWRFVLGASLLAGAALLSATSAKAEAFGPSALSEGSLNMAGGSIAVVAGSPLLLVGVPDFSIIGVEHVAKGVRLTLRGTAESAALVLMVPVAAAAGAALVVGGTVAVVAVAGGWVLSCGGVALGHVAREASDALLFSEPASRCCPGCC